MPGPDDLDARLDRLSAEVDAWTRAFFERHRPAADRFAGLISYPLGWVDTALRPLDPPAPAGKRLRPAVCLLVCEAVGGDHRPALAPAAAIELVHNFSLVHDDIQDESPLRRGRPTVWAGWQTAQAINVGDSLFALAQLAVVDADHCPAELLVAAARRLNQTCLRLVEGQFLDLELQAAGSASLTAYQTMVGGKTAALLECATWLGARFGGADQARAERFAAFGRQIGLAFQFQDDLLGIWGDPALTGKSAETDLRTRKQALPAVLALQASGSDADRFRELFLAPGEMSAEQARAAAELLEALGIRQRADRMVEAGYARAADDLRAALGEQPDSPLWALLRKFRDRSA
jgi:geranylgeranyl diphosphate synthase type I